MSQRNGFTLIELVVVIMILGILAAVAAPKLLNTSATAIDNGLKQTLAVVRDAIELFVAENGGTLPTLLRRRSQFPGGYRALSSGAVPDLSRRTGRRPGPNGRGRERTDNYRRRQSSRGLEIQYGHR